MVSPPGFVPLGEMLTFVTNCRYGDYDRNGSVPLIHIRHDLDTKPPWSPSLFGYLLT